MKLFIVSKIYDTEKQSTAEIEESVQKDLDCYVGENKVKFKLYTLGCVAAMYFNRHLNYSTIGANPKTDICCVDGFIISGDGFQGFRLLSFQAPR